MFDLYDVCIKVSNQLKLTLKKMAAFVTGTLSRKKIRKKVPFPTLWSQRSTNLPQKLCPAFDSPRMSKNHQYFESRLA